MSPSRGKEKPYWPAQKGGKNGRLKWRWEDEVFHQFVEVKKSLLWLATVNEKQESEIEDALRASLDRKLKYYWKAFEKRLKANKIKNAARMKLLREKRARERVGIVDEDELPDNFGNV
jgi:hypothetical protein